jgi:hypothetical protein
MNKCAICGKDAINRCSKCNQVSYCSRECQKTDWKSHKLECGNIAISINVYEMLRKQIKDTINEFILTTNVIEITITETLDEFISSAYPGYPHFAYISGRDFIDGEMSGKKICRMVFNGTLLKYTLPTNAESMRPMEKITKTVYFEY